MILQVNVILKVTENHTLCLSIRQARSTLLRIPIGGRCWARKSAMEDSMDAVCSKVKAMKFKQSVFLDLIFMHQAPHILCFTEKNQNIISFENAVGLRNSQNLVNGGVG